MTDLDTTSGSPVAPTPAPVRVLLVVLGAFLALLAFAGAAGGGVLVWAHTTQRDAAGYYSTNTERLQTAAYALVSEEIDFGTRIGDGDWSPFDEQRGDVRVRAARPDGEDVFIGVARPAAVEAYLAGVPYDEVTSSGAGPFDVDYRFVPGERAPETPPGMADFWSTSVSGPGRQTLVWDVDAGPWTVVVMNTNADRSVVVDLSVGARTGLLLPAGVLLLGFAAVATLLAVALIVIGAGGSGRGLYDHVAPLHGAQPVRLDGHLDLQLSRWMWLVKWFLALPHFFVLALLWPVAIVLTWIAWFAILFTGRYPRALFDLNVGVMRWTWRVTFYAFTLGTDRYPPFSLAPDPSYPADLAVDYPPRLSRGLVLVKWLLALPHYVVLAVFVGLGATGWRDERTFDIFNGGVVSLLVFVAAIVLLVSGRYPQQLFDVVMGMQRWTYRVYAYIGLMTDAYPPFRFEGGGTDPSSMPSHPPAPSPVDLRV